MRYRDASDALLLEQPIPYPLLRLHVQRARQIIKMNKSAPVISMRAVAARWICPRQHYAPRTDKRLQSLIQILDILLHDGQPNSPFQSFLGPLFLPLHDVLSQGIAKQPWNLRSIGRPRRHKEGCRIHLFPVPADRPFLFRRQSQQCPDKRRFPAPIRPVTTRNLPRSRRKLISDMPFSEFG